MLAEVAQTVDHVVINNKGRLVTFSPLTELTARLSCGVRVRAPSIVRLQSALEAKGVRSTILDGNELMVEGAPSARVGEIAFNAGFPLHELVPQSSTLEDVFLKLTAKETS